jgi:hypothetical protein
MLGDMVAMSKLYGLSTTTRTGDTVYGFNSNAGGIYVASGGPTFAYTIIDSGGTDTLDYSGYTVAQRIDLNPDTFSNIGGDTGNVAIARGTIIENAIGGSGADVIIGNSVANVLTGGAGIDTLTGGAGNDTFRGTKAGLNGDTITDLTVSDKIVIIDASLTGFSFSLSGTTLTYTGGSLRLSAPISGTVTASGAAGGGVQLAISTTTTPTPSADVRDDFNGDGRSDLIWRHDNGAFTNWLGQASGGFVSNDANAFRNLPTSWHVAGTGDFNGDGRDDVLWRNDNGALTNWMGQPNGGFVSNDLNAMANLPVSWQVAGTGDFNSDGRDDIIWRRTDGAFTEWLGQANGGFISNDANAWTVLPTSWRVDGTGDFNGDGNDDVLWRRSDGAFTEWLGQDNGGFVSNDANAFRNLPNSWQVAGTGDFNGDNRDDVAWRRDDGAFTVWLGQSNGGFITNDANAWAAVPTSWQVAATGDYNGDGRDDIAWRNSNGTFTNWLGQANGGFVSNDANAWTVLTTAWHVQGPDSWL